MINKRPFWVIWLGRHLRIYKIIAEMTILRHKIAALEGLCIQDRIEALEHRFSEQDDRRKTLAAMPRRAVNKDPMYQALPEEMRAAVDWERLGYEREEE